MEIKRHPHGVALVPPDTAWDESLPGEIHLTWEEAEQLATELETILRNPVEKIEPTPNNPTGTVRQCDRRDIHSRHDYQADFGAYFDVHCPGNSGTQR